MNRLQSAHAALRRRNVVMARVAVDDIARARGYQWIEPM